MLEWRALYTPWLGQCKILFFDHFFLCQLMIAMSVFKILVWHILTTNGGRICRCCVCATHANVILQPVSIAANIHNEQVVRDLFRLSLNSVEQCPSVLGNARVDAQVKRCKIIDYSYVKSFCRKTSVGSLGLHHFDGMHSMGSLDTRRVRPVLCSDGYCHRVYLFYTYSVHMFEMKHCGCSIHGSPYYVVF